MKTIRMGVIGSGGIANAHIQGIQNSPAAELLALCDTCPDSLQAIGEKHGIPETMRFRNHRDLLSCAEVDAVSICTPNDSHYQIALDAVACRKPFALEKPVTLSYEEARRLEEATRAAGLPSMVCFSYRFKAAARYARQLIREGALGRIFHVYIQYLQSWAINENLPLVWRLQKGISGSGALGDLGVHMIDLARFLVGDFLKVTAHTGTFVTSRKLVDRDEYGTVDVDDYCHILAELEGGIAATFAITRFAYARDNFQRVEVYGSRGALVYNLEDTDTLQVCLGDIYREARLFSQLPVPPRYQADQMQSFFDRVNGIEDNLAATIVDGSISQKVVEAVLAAAETGTWVEISRIGG